MANFAIYFNMFNHKQSLIVSSGYRQFLSSERFGLYFGQKAISVYLIHDFHS